MQQQDEDNPSPPLLLLLLFSCFMILNPPPLLTLIKNNHLRKVIIIIILIIIILQEEHTQHPDYHLNHGMRREFTFGIVLILMHVFSSSLPNVYHQKQKGSKRGKRILVSDHRLLYFHK